MNTRKELWWMLLIKGIVLVLLGLLAISWPQLTFAVLAYLFSFYILITGVVNTVYGIVGISSRRNWFLMLLLGIAEIGVSIYILRIPALTLAVFIGVLGFTFMIQGILEIVVAFTDEDTGVKVLEIIAGVLGLIAGFFILRYPAASGLAFVWIVGIYGLIAGAIRIGMAISAYSFGRGREARSKRTYAM